MTKRASAGRPHLWLVRIGLCSAALFAAAGCAAVKSGGGTGADSAAHLTREQSAPVLRLARASRANGDLVSAINLYRSVIAIKPVDSALLVELGDTLVEAGSIDEAIETYQQVQQPAAARVGALLGLEQAYLTLGQADKGLQCADQANALAPLDRRVLIGRGVALDMLSRHKEAQDSYRTVLAATPHDIAARNDLALSLAFSRQFAEAIEILTPMARSSSATPRIRQNLALVYGLAGDTAHAAELSHMDLDANSTQQNLRFFEFAHAASQ